MPESSADIRALTDFSGARPPWVRAVNALADPVKRWVSLDADQLMNAARRRTGLSDFGSDDDFEPLLRSLAKSLEEEAHLTFIGRLLARRDVFVILCNRLMIAALQRSQPEIFEAPVSEPLFITGLARSGTTILHELLAEDPAYRTVATWEARYPCPPPAPGDASSRRRLRIAHEEIMLWHKLVPPYRAMHENAGHLPTECGDLTCHTFLGDRLPALYQVPSFAAFAGTRPTKPMYEMHRKILQILQSKSPGGRWLLKAPAHMNWLESLLEVYPDARIVQTHRDPLSSMGSTVSLISAIMWMRTDQLDPEIVKLAFGPAYYEPQLYKVMEQREKGVVPDAQIYDVRFQDLMGDPWTSIGGMYAHFDWEYTEESRQRMQTYLANKPRGKHGKHTYDFHDLGLDLATERARYERYQDHYGVKSEIT